MGSAPRQCSAPSTSPLASPPAAKPSLASQRARFGASGRASGFGGGHSAALPARTPVLRYEAWAPLAVRGPWWAFLARWKNIKMTALALAWWAASLAVHARLSRMSWDRGAAAGMVGVPPLKDVLHEVLPSMQRLRVLPEIGHTLPVLYLSGLMLAHFDQRSLDCFRTFLLAHGALLLTRGLAFIGTLLPDASQQCHTSLFVGGCHDLIFSGHVSISMLAEKRRSPLYPT